MRLAIPRFPQQVQRRLSKPGFGARVRFRLERVRDERIRARLASVNESRGHPREISNGRFAVYVVALLAIVATAFYQFDTWRVASAWLEVKLRWLIAFAIVFALAGVCVVSAGDFPPEIAHLAGFEKIEGSFCFDLERKTHVPCSVYRDADGVRYEVFLYVLGGYPRKIMMMPPGRKSRVLWRHDPYCHDPACVWASNNGVRAQPATPFY